jgi:hypothetical protein
MTDCEKPLVLVIFCALRHPKSRNFLMEALVARFVAAHRSGDVFGQTSFVECEPFWTCIGALWRVDPFLCSVAVAKRCLLFPDDHAVTGVALLCGMVNCPVPILKQIALARARLFIAGKRLVGTVDAFFLEQLASLKPSDGLVARIGPEVWKLCCDHPQADFARLWVPLLLRSNPRLDLMRFVDSDALLDAISTRQISFQSHGQVFAAMCSSNRAELAVVLASSSIPSSLRVTVLPRVAEEIALGNLSAFRVVLLVDDPSELLLTLFRAMLVGLSKAIEDKEVQREAEKGFLHVYSRIGAQAYGNVLISMMDGKVNAEQRESLWRASFPVVDARLASVLQVRAWTLNPGSSEAVAVFLGRVALCDESDISLARSVEWLVRASTKASAKSVLRLCQQSAHRMSAFLGNLMTAHEQDKNGLFADSIAFLCLSSGRLDVFFQLVDLNISRSRLKPLLEVSHLSQVALAAVGLAQRWARMVGTFSDEGFWHLASALVQNLGQGFAPMAAATIDALLRVSKSRHLEAALFTYGLLIQEFHSEMWWFPSLFPVCQLLFKQEGGAADAGLLTCFYQIMLQPLFYNSERVIASADLVGLLIRAALQGMMVSSSALDVELHRAMSQMVVVLMGKRAGESNPEWRGFKKVFVFFFFFFFFFFPLFQLLHAVVWAEMLF